MIETSSGQPLSVLAFVPILGRDREFQHGGMRLRGKPLLEFTLEACRASRYVDRTVVSTDSEDIAQAARALGAETPFLRTGVLADRTQPVISVVQANLQWLAAHRNWRPDVVVLLEVTHPLRSDGLIDQVIEVLVSEQLDSVFAAREERHQFWAYTAGGELERIGQDELNRPREVKAPLYKELDGLALATRTAVIEQGRRLGDRIGVVPVRNLSSLIDLHDPEGVELAERFLRTEQG